MTKNLVDVKKIINFLKYLFEAFADAQRSSQPNVCPLYVQNIRTHLRHFL